MNFESTGWNELKSLELYEAVVIEFLLNTGFQQRFIGGNKQLDIILTDNPDPIANITVDDRMK